MNSGMDHWTAISKVSTYTTVPTHCSCVNLPCNVFFRIQIYYSCMLLKLNCHVPRQDAVVTGTVILGNIKSRSPIFKSILRFYTPCAKPPDLSCLTTVHIGGVTFLCGHVVGKNK